MRNALSRYTLLVRRWVWLILLGIALCSTMTYVITKFMHPVYQASTQLVLTITTSQSPYDNTTAALELLPTYAQLITSPAVLLPVAAQHTEIPEMQLVSMVTVKPQSNTQIIEIDVEQSNPQLATQLANEIAQSFARYANTQLDGTVKVHIIPAQQPINPMQPKPAQDALIGALVGLGISLSLMVIFEWVDDRIENPEELQEQLATTVLTTIPVLSRIQRLKHAEETPELAEGCRLLCSQVQMMQATQPFKLLMVTSALPHEGKSTIAANLASFLAQTEKRVLLVDANLRHPVMDQHFQLDNRQGISHALRGLWTHNDDKLVGQPTEIPTLRVLTAGLQPVHPTEMLQASQTQELFDYFRTMEQFDYIVFDTPPLLPIADAQIIAAYVPNTILVVDASRTPRKIIKQAKQVLERAGGRLLGITLNKSRWPQYAAIRSYRSSIQKQPPLTLSIPSHTPHTNGKIEVDVAITESLLQPEAKGDS